MSECNKYEVQMIKYEMARTVTSDIFTLSVVVWIEVLSWIVKIDVNYVGSPGLVSDVVQVSFIQLWNIFVSL